MREDEKKTKRIQIRTTAEVRTAISNFCKDNQLGKVSEFMLRVALEKIEGDKDTKTGDDLNLKWIAKDLASINRKVAKGRVESEKLQAELENFREEVW
jgi:hypothetical protein